ncbi:hypothetical protein O9992_11505 [Vibrio lentus]|nr:hypothetical protein [Vibrio lentus]
MLKTFLDHYGAMTIVVMNMYTGAKRLALNSGFLYRISSLGACKK